jgi:hypothetical protein
MAGFIPLSRTAWMKRAVVAGVTYRFTLAEKASFDVRMLFGVSASAYYERER